MREVDDSVEPTAEVALYRMRDGEPTAEMVLSHMWSAFWCWERELAERTWRTYNYLPIDKRIAMVRDVLEEGRACHDIAVRAVRIGLNRPEPVEGGGSR